MLNEIARWAKEGQPAIEPSKRYDGLLEEFECVFEKVSEKHYPEYVGWNLWLYGGQDFPLLQCIWPTTSGVFPWETNATEEFRKWQIILSE